MVPRPTLSLALVGLPVAPLREQVSAAAAGGYGAIQLNAAAAGVRPRDLGRSARRDLAAVLKRASLACSGLDLWIPPEHFADAANADRALGAVTVAVELASELASLGVASRADMAVCVELPTASATGVHAAIRLAGERAGVAVADHAWPVRPQPDGIAGVRDVGVDPAAILSGGGDPSSAILTIGPRLASVRLTDCSRLGARVAAASAGGRLDLLAYKAALAASGHLPGRWVTVDLRGVPDAETAAPSAVERWASIGP